VKTKAKHFYQYSSNVKKVSTTTDASVLASIDGGAILSVSPSVDWQTVSGNVFAATKDGLNLSVEEISALTTNRATQIDEIKMTDLGGPL
jgi:hypothetical protein